LTKRYFPRFNPSNWKWIDPGVFTYQTSAASIGKGSISGGQHRGLRKGTSIETANGAGELKRELSKLISQFNRN
jgi:hypothetical protein